MMLKQGQIINDGENDLIVCATKEHEGSWYVYLLNDKNDDVGFYKIVDLGEEYDFELVKDEKKVEELILIFAKDYAEKNPDALKEIEKLKDSKIDEE